MVRAKVAVLVLMLLFGGCALQPRVLASRVSPSTLDTDHPAVHRSSREKGHAGLGSAEEGRGPELDASLAADPLLLFPDPQANNGSSNSAPANNTVPGPGHTMAPQGHGLRVLQEDSAVSLPRNNLPAGMGEPAGLLNGQCRTALAKWIKDGGVCAADAVADTCTSVASAILEWRVLCASGLFSSRADAVFMPSLDGDLGAKWGVPYAHLLGSVSGGMNSTTRNEEQTAVFNRVQKSAVLGPVLKAVVASQGQHARALLFAWTMSISELMHPLPRDMIAKLVLGGVALKQAKVPFTLDNTLEGQSLDDRMRRRLLQSDDKNNQFIIISNLGLNAAKGSGFTRDFKLIPQLNNWFSTPLPNLGFPGMEENTKTFFSCDSKTIASELRLAGSVSFNGGSFAASAKASINRAKQSASSKCVASLSKRVVDVVDQVNTLDIGDMPLLSSEALSDLKTLQEAAFEAKYGAYFVLATTKYAFFDAFCSTKAESSSSDVEIEATLSGEGWGFSAEMEASWKQARDKGKMSFECPTSGSCDNMKDLQDIQGIFACSNSAANVNSERTENFQIVLMRYSDLANWDPSVVMSVPPPLSTPFNLLDAQLQEDMSEAWARASFLEKTLLQRLSPDEQFIFAPNLERIMFTLSALASRRPVPANGAVVTFYDSDTYKVPQNSITYTAATGPSFKVWYLEGKVTSVAIGEGVVVSLSQQWMWWLPTQPDPDSVSGTALVAAGRDLENLSYFPTSGGVSFDNVVCSATIEALSTLTNSRMVALVTALRLDLDAAEAQWAWIGAGQPRQSQVAHAEWSAFEQASFQCSPTESLQQFKLLPWDYQWTKGTFNFSCSLLPVLARANTRTVSKVSEQEYLDIRDLSRHAIACDGRAGGMIQSVRLATFWLMTWKLRVEYTCLVPVNPAPDAGNCRVLTTPTSDAITWGIMSLSRHDVRCLTTERMTDFKLVLASGAGFINFEYTCCSLPRL